MSWFSAYNLIVAPMMTTGEVWDSSPTKGGSGMKRMFAPARDCDAALLKGKPAFTGQPIPETVRCCRRYPSHYYYLIALHNSQAPTWRFKRLMRAVIGAPHIFVWSGASLESNKNVGVSLVGKWTTPELARLALQSKHFKGTPPFTPRTLKPGVFTQ